MRYAKRDAFRDAPLEERVDERDPARRQRLGIRTRTQFMVEAGGEKHEFRRLVARIVGAMAEMHARAAQDARTTIEGLAHRFPRNGRSPCCCAGFSGCVG